jgi:hypothetical protein
VARANCTPQCQWHDWQGQLYNNNSPAFESVLTSSGGLGTARFYASVNDRQVHGVMQNTGARRTSGRVNLDQTFGEHFTIATGIDITHNFVQDGLGNNDNSGTSPMYALGYAPAIYDLRQIDPGTGRKVAMFMNGGSTGTSNPFDVIHEIRNDEDTWRQTGNIRLNYSALSTLKNTVQLTYIGGVDRYQLEGTQYAPNYLQFEPADGFLGTSQILTADSRFINQSFNAVWTFAPGWKWFNSAQTSVGTGTTSACADCSRLARSRRAGRTSPPATTSRNSATSHGTSTSRSSRSTKSWRSPSECAPIAERRTATVRSSTHSRSSRGAIGSLSHSAFSPRRSTR